MRSTVMRQMKKPMLKTTMRPMRLPRDMLSPMIKGSGRKNIMRSVTRLETAFVQLNCIRIVIRQRGFLGLPMPREIYAGAGNRAVPNSWDWIALEGVEEQVCYGPYATDDHHNIQEFAEAGGREDAVVEH